MKQRVYSFDLIRVISCFAVVVLHACTLAVNTFAPDTALRESTMAMRNVTMFAVPCFVMVTGALLLDPQHPVTLEKVLKQYLKRALIVLIAFTLLFSIYDGIAGGSGIVAVLLDFLKDLYSNGSWLHMWYMYLLIGIYLSLPLLRKLVSSTTGQERKYMLIIFFVFLSVLPTLNSLTGFTSGFYILFYSIYPFYLLLGYEIHQNHIKAPVWLSALMAAGSAAAIVILTVISVASNTPALLSLCTNYASVLVVCEASGIFTLLDKPHARKLKLVPKIDPLTFGIYLIHVLFLKILFSQLNFNPFASGGIWMILLISIAVFILTAVAAFLLRKISIVKKYL